MMLEVKPDLSSNRVFRNLNYVNFYSACLTYLSRARTFLYSFITTICNIPFYIAAKGITAERKLEVYGRHDQTVSTKWHYSLALDEIREKTFAHLHEQKKIKIDENTSILLQERVDSDPSSVIYKIKKIKNGSSSWLFVKQEKGFNQQRKNKIYHEAWVLDKMEMLEYFVIAPDHIFLMIQPYINGYDLGSLPPTYHFRFNTLLIMAIELFTQLNKLHQLGLIHSDAWNRNVMLQLDDKNCNNIPKLFLIDFGASNLKSATFLGWYFQLMDTIDAWDIIYKLFKKHILIQEKDKHLYSDFMRYIRLNTFTHSTLFCTSN